MRDLLNTALGAAEAAARVHRARLGEVKVEDARDKGVSDFVSRVDLEAQEAALDRIRSDFPEHEIMAEEDDRTSLDPGDAGGTPVWVVDPLDGTTNFLHGHPAYVSSVGVLRNGRPLAGAVVASATGERWWAERGEGAFRNGSPIRVSGTRDLRLALVGTGFPFKHLDRLDEYLEQFRRVLPSTSGIRRGGSAALDLCYLAQGSLDVFWELHLDPWDIAAGVCILEEAGGVARSMEGGPLDILAGGSVIGGNSAELLSAFGAVVTGESDRASPSDRGAPGSG